jgi:hypothetical protein
LAVPQSAAAQRYKQYAARNALPLATAAIGKERGEAVARFPSIEIVFRRSESD